MGELLIKFAAAPAAGRRLRCRIQDNAGRVCQTTVRIEQAAITIPFVGFSRAMDRAYVYVQNKSDRRLSVGLSEVAGINAGDNYHSINSDLQPGDKGCLIFEIQRPFALGDYVHVGVRAICEEQVFQTFRVVRALNRFPLMFGDGQTDADIGLDSERFFVNSTKATREFACVQTMLCPAHGHGSNHEAAVKFLANRAEIFGADEVLLTQMWICRADKPRAWYEFGGLPDVAVMNPILWASEGISSFGRLGRCAKTATEPNRYLACVDLVPSESIFVESQFRPEEVRYLVYCVLASPLLMIAEPVDWSSSADTGYWTKSLLCANAAILVLVFDGRYLSEDANGRMRTPGFSRSAKPVRVKVRVPPQFSVSRIEKSYAAVPAKRWDFDAGRLEFECLMADSVQVYKVILNRNDVIVGAGP
jgi:hypothetical protein